MPVALLYHPKSRGLGAEVNGARSGGGPATRYSEKASVSHCGTTRDANKNSRLEFADAKAKIGGVLNWLRSWWPSGMSRYPVTTPGHSAGFVAHSKGLVRALCFITIGTMTCLQASIHNRLNSLADMGRTDCFLG